MWHVACTLFLMLLFFLLTPGVVLSLPKGGTLQQKALVHAVVFGVVVHFLHQVMIHYHVSY
jgi:hypothetical protein